MRLQSRLAAAAVLAETAIGLAARAVAAAVHALEVGEVVVVVGDILAGAYTREEGTRAFVAVEVAGDDCVDAEAREDGF